jgi:hypothetical protein
METKQIQEGTKMYSLSLTNYIHFRVILSQAIQIWPNS